MFRIGTVPFLVARPLAWELEHHDEVELTLASPSELGRLLCAGELDIALASSVLVTDSPELEFWTDGPVIASRGPVRSVLVLLRPGVRANEVRSLALDPASRSGRALAQVILREVHHAAPMCAEVDPETALNGASFDAVQVIGDRALQLSQRFANWQTLDLGEAWTNWTGLPFVFAGWIAREGFPAEQVASILRASSVEGLQQRARLLPEAVELLGHDENFMRRYLFEDLVYTLSPHEVRSALSAFRTLIVQISR
jgi:chorismate dehydratase